MENQNHSSSIENNNNHSDNNENHNHSLVMKFASVNLDVSRGGENQSSSNSNINENQASGDENRNHSQVMKFARVNLDVSRGSENQSSSSSNTNENQASSGIVNQTSNSNGQQFDNSIVEDETTSDQKFWIPDVPTYAKPTNGLVFGSLDRGIAFYGNYALLSGFDFRKSTSVLSNDGVVKLKYLVCSKEGIKPSKPFDSLKDRRLNKSESRTGCDACVKFRRCKDGTSYFIYFFEEKHNHELVRVVDRHLLKQRRHLDYVQKSFIVNVSNANIGPSVAHKVMKEMAGSYENVGGTIVDYKNFNKELNCFIGDSDAQMIVDKLEMKREDVPGFSFEYMCGDNHMLTGLFWADRKGKQNYEAYGDIISFDATYNTNKYRMVFVPFTGVDKHKRCVTFGAGLLAKEKIESYTWLLQAFLKSFDNKQPRVVVTDQDASMKQAVEDVFPNSRHRLCMWHIMKKLKDKVPYSVFNDSEFCERFNYIVWNANTNPIDFENKWMSIIQEYKLEKIKWLSDMFDIRDSWIPAYFRDLPMSGLMRTTSRSESENYFFGRFSHPCSMLVRFLSRFESAMDKQRSMQRSLDHKMRTTTPVFRTPRKIERHAAKVYTRTVFYEVQNEIYESVFSCSQVSFTIENGSKLRIIEERDKEMNVKGEYKVVCDESNGKMTCRCMKFVRYGILCRHMFCALWLSGIVEIPGEYIVKRWTMDAEDVDLLDMDIECSKGDSAVLQDVYSTVRHSLSRLSINKERLHKYQEQLHKLRDEIDAELLEEPAMTAKETMEALLGVSQPSTVIIQVPKGIRNKGCGSGGKRMCSERDKAIEKSSKPKRLCKLCGEYAHHDSRNCPSKDEE